MSDGGGHRLCVEVGGGGWRQVCLRFCLSYLHFLLVLFCCLSVLSPHPSRVS